MQKAVQDKHSHLDFTVNTEALLIVLEILEPFLLTQAIAVLERSTAPNLH